MPFTDGTLATFMQTELGATGVALSLTAGSDAILAAVDEVAAVLGSAIADVDDDLKLRAVARWQAWRTAKGAASGQFDLKAGSASLTRSQHWDHINDMLRDAEAAASRYPDVAVVIYRFRRAVPVTGQLTTTAPVTPAYPPDGNDPAYAGSPYRGRGRRP